MSRTIEPDERPLTLAGRDAYLHLSVAVLKQAVQDARLGHKDAALWLSSQDALPFLAVAGIGPETIGQWLEKRFPSNILM